MSLKVCIFCGSQRGNDPRLAEEAFEFGRLMPSAGLELVYGGGKVGLMGVIADGVLAGGGRVTGIIPQFLSTAEVAREDLTHLEFVETLEARKRRMFEVSDLFVTLPGGLGTLDELFEALTLRQLALHEKPIHILNWQGFYSQLEKQLHSMCDAGFFTPEALALAQFHYSFSDLLKACAG